jgi:predicted O-linked N-acetylglucosamine transferase (SPINDLY family)
MATLAEALAVALAHHQAGRLAPAEEIYRRILAIEPQQADALHLLGLIEHQAGRSDTALDLVRRAIAAHPASATYHNSLGAIRKDQGDLAAAAASYRRAIELEPNYVDAHLNLGCVLQSQGMFDEAVACFRRVLRHEPNLAEVHCNLGSALKALGRIDEAVACYRRAVELQPQMAEAHYNLGNAWRTLGDLPVAVACYRRSLQLRPDAAEVHNNLGNALQELGESDDAAASYRRALELKPDYVEALTNLGTVRKNQGNLDEAIACYDRAIKLRPDDASAHSNRLYAIHFSPAYDADAIGREARRWNAQFAAPLHPAAPAHTNDRSPDRRLRVGYVSSDLRAHPVGRFLLPLLEAHDHRGFEIFCYSSLFTPDALTDRLRAAADVWRDVSTLSDAQLAEAIVQDRIDVLVDLTMHMGGCRLPAFARKPAPVQATYLAYCSTTGVGAIDYRLTDPWLDPPDADLRYYAERSMWLPETYWCYRPPLDTPAVNRLPALTAGRITFGCLNQFCKVTPPVLTAWCRILESVPASRLLLHCHAGSPRDAVQRLFDQRGIASNRLTFVGVLPTEQYFELYRQIDLALDPFPYCGGTTTCDALWMGVPVVSLAGRTAVGRGGLSILSNVGLPELVARDTEQYVQIAAHLAADRPRLADLRATLRQRMQESPLMDAPRFARNVEATYREMWRRWCAEV